jgi:putative transposase
MNLQRKYPARRSYSSFGNRADIIFVTVCTRGRKPILCVPDVHILLRTCWSDVAQWVMGRYVLMPDHLHFFCAPAVRDAGNVRDWVAYWKSYSATHWPRPDERPVWQREAWDRQVRRGESYTEKWQYVRHNPVRAGLAAAAEDWPYQGEMNVLTWHDA